MSTKAAILDVPADWMPRLVSMQADLEAMMKDAEPLRTIRRKAVAALRASDDAAVVDSCAKEDYQRFLDAFADLETAARQVSRVLATW